MKRIPIKDLERDVEAVINSAQSERIVISRGGKPCALLVGIENYDAEDMRLANSEDFWRMIHQRRTRGESIPLAEVEARLNEPSTRPTKKRAASKKGRKRS